MGSSDVHVEIVTLFPEVFRAYLEVGMIGRAVASGSLSVGLRDLRAHGKGRHLSVDDTPYGGGSGMLLRVDCVVECLEAAERDMGERGRRILLTPQGERFHQKHAARLAGEPRLVLVCGRYEGFDERARHYVDEELSLGDFVMTGGELAALAVLDATARLLPDVLGNDESALEESHGDALGGLLEYPHYTRPAEFRGERVPEILTSGDHAKIRAWRLEQARARTAARRPDLALRAEEKARS
jgi:tRNA (guanine37-N1)-methyltransferase